MSKISVEEYKELTANAGRFIKNCAKAFKQALERFDTAFRDSDWDTAIFYDAMLLVLSTYSDIMLYSWQEFARDYFEADPAAYKDALMQFIAVVDKEGIPQELRHKARKLDKDFLHAAFADSNVKYSDGKKHKYTEDLKKVCLEDIKDLNLYELFMGNLK